MADAPAPDDSGIPPFHFFRALFALFVIGVGVYLIATANKPTETVTARVNYRYIPFSRADTVDFKFADSSALGERRVLVDRASHMSSSNYGAKPRAATAASHASGHS